jgi:hypothetical protein
MIFLLKHLLIEKAYEYPLPHKEPTMQGCKYDNVKGYWTYENNNKPVILDKNFIKPRTKKADRETGEDQKGE